MRFQRLPLRDIALRRARAYQDRDLIATGWTPLARDLAKAPLIDDYYEGTDPQGRQRLHGKVTGHPDLGDGVATTSPVVARGDGWVRTEGRFYKLGQERAPGDTNAARLAAILATLPVVEVKRPAPGEDDDPLSDLPTY
ncbi:DUF6634 family protein [Methylobacterium sp. 37f]|uniref:DUF6634 family protein n=1 Tax=Methylobacterium sp. 37f TaxID=2817058 RepID=UPI001FFC5A86|nr:DUF6634 family protein [Methylobacterium sp. 37f]MCK2055288.1 hypothetical protein [Methylobacterium sp. 37f]